MSDHINPKFTIVVERWEFNKAKQGKDESITEFAGRLRKLSLFYDLEKLDDAFREQFVCWVHHKNPKIELFKIKDWKFDEGVKEALAHENAWSKHQTIFW